jgi:alpha-D-ribose 1-methylphosphonate 5-triphosphate synthase subunit PhnG
MPVPDTDRKRQRWLSVLARADAAGFDERLPLERLPAEYVWLRQPESGLVMVCGRAGGTGSAFNLGEMSVTRCALRLTDGTVGMACLRGRDSLHAQRAALIDALMQQAGQDDSLEQAWTTWITPLEARQLQQRIARAAAAAKTRVEFFTVVRGEDAS